MGACTLLLGAFLAVHNALTGSDNVVVVLFWVFMSGGPVDDRWHLRPQAAVRTAESLRSIRWRCFGSRLPLGCR